MSKHFFSIIPAAVLLPLVALTTWAQTGSTGADWLSIGGDPGGTKYSPLNQIDASNVGKLKVAWRWKSENFGARPDFNWEVTAAGRQWKAVLFGGDAARGSRD